ncbi:MAG: toxin glutamine deamidase domain-containing protein [Sodalis sp. (in: enterobacteria)]|uniref:toxin glutamine deamidase domain-containing protein n=1 Tax=Sodalis sp. (in: enterobacteria) TaxID=1898979 RepID=UPI0039E6F598
MNPTNTFDKTRLPPILPSFVQSTYHDTSTASMSSNIQEVVNTVPTFVSLKDFQQNISHITLNDINAVIIGGVTYSLMGEGDEKFFSAGPDMHLSEAFPGEQINDVIRTLNDLLHQKRFTTDNAALPPATVDQNSPSPSSTSEVPDKEFSLITVSAEKDNILDSAEYRTLIVTEGRHPPTYSPAEGQREAYKNKLSDYLRGPLLKEVNHHGASPLWLRPLAWVCDLFGFHGVGQTNCLSCATAVADTLKEGQLHCADPTLRGGSPSQFSTLKNAVGGMFDSIAAMLDRANAQPRCNAVLCVKRPRSLWSRLFSPTDGHACNVVKVDQTLFLVDAQKRRCRTLSTTDDRAIQLRQITHFLGPIASGPGCLQWFDVGF